MNVKIQHIMSSNRPFPDTLEIDSDATVNSMLNTLSEKHGFNFHDWPIHFIQIIDNKTVRTDIIDTDRPISSFAVTDKSFFKIHISRRFFIS